jgi:predicted DCC family thiol-disulfide oxidoreductase YuxK
MNETASPVLLYDGLCGYCNAVVRIIAGIDTKARIRFAPLQSALGESVLSRHPEIAEVESAVLVEHLGAENERIALRWNLSRRIAKYLTGFWKLVFVLLGAVPLPIGNRIYDLIAQNRYRIFGKYDTCRMPSEKLRRRLADFPK